MELLINNPTKEFTIDQITVTVSSGFYVRQFVSDFAKKFDATATTFYIKRTQIGDYKVEDSVK